MAKRKPKKTPPYRATLGPANLSWRETEIRLNRVIDLLIEEVGRRREDEKKRRGKKAA